VNYHSWHGKLKIFEMPCQNNVLDFVAAHKNKFVSCIMVSIVCMLMFLKTQSTFQEKDVNYKYLEYNKVWRNYDASNNKKNINSIYNLILLIYQYNFTIKCVSFIQ
jgi:hypothetical protein